jgi:hypothetical protein
MERDVQMSIEAASPLTRSITFISYGKIMFHLRVCRLFIITGISDYCHRDLSQ